MTLAKFRLPTGRFPWELSCNYVNLREYDIDGNLSLSLQNSCSFLIDCTDPHWRKAINSKFIEINFYFNITIHAWIFHDITYPPCSKFKNLYTFYVILIILNLIYESPVSPKLFRQSRQAICLSNINRELAVILHLKLQHVSLFCYNRWNVKYHRTNSSCNFGPIKNLLKIQYIYKGCDCGCVREECGSIKWMSIGSRIIHIYIYWGKIR